MSTSTAPFAMKLRHLVLVALCVIVALQCTQASADVVSVSAPSEASSPGPLDSAGPVLSSIVKCICRCRNLVMLPVDVPNCVSCSRGFCVNTWARCAEVADGGTVYVSAPLPLPPARFAASCTHFPVHGTGPVLAMVVPVRCARVGQPGHGRGGRGCSSVTGRL